MGNPGNNHKINYIEFVSADVARSREFYSTVFGWSFEDWGRGRSRFPVCSEVWGVNSEGSVPKGFCPRFLPGRGSSRGSGFDRRY